MRKARKKILKITLITLACLFVTYLGISAFGAREAMVVPRLPLTVAAGSLGVAYEDVSFPTRIDNLALKGWFLPGPASQAVIIVHGGFQNRIDENADTPGLARALVQKGYNVLLYDLRGRGESEGRGQTLSHIDEDIGGAVDYLKSRGFASKDICVLGFCSGATMTAIFASRNEVGAVILDGCFVDDGTMVVRQGQEIHVPGWATRAFVPGGMVMTRLVYGFHRIDAIDVVPDIKCPVLFVHESLDPFTTAAETQRMYRLVPNPIKDFLEIPGARHSQGFVVSPQVYIDKIDGFLKTLK